MRFMVYGVEPALAHSLELCFANTPHQLVIAADVVEAEAYVADTDIDAALLDAHFEAAGSVGLSAYLRRRGNKTPLVLYGPASPTEAARWLDTVDAILRPPVSPIELVATLIAHGRRRHGEAARRLVHGQLVLDTRVNAVFIGDKPLRLTGKEHELLQCLLFRSGSVLTKEHILSALYENPNDEPELKIIDVFVCKLRKKLADAGLPNLIETVWGRGYVIRKPGFAAAPERVRRAPTVVAA